MEGAPFQLYPDRRRWCILVACCECLPDTHHIHMHFGKHGMVDSITLNPDTVAPRQECRVGFDIFHQCVHLCRAVTKLDCFVDCRHNGWTGNKTVILNKDGEKTMSIADNKKAFHDYFIEERHEAGMVLEGWEVKAIRAGRVQLKEAYVIIRGGEIYLFGAHISPLTTASTHIKPDPVRDRKLLLHADEISKLIGKVERAGYTLVPLNLHYAKGRIKCEIGLAKGKKQYDKRDAEKKRDWQREQNQLLKQNRR